MATKKKRRKTTASKKKAAAAGSPSPFRSEVILWCVLAVSILLFLSNFGVGGKVGGAIGSFFFGCFGILSYIFPILLFMGTAFGLSNRNVPAAKRKLIAICVLFVLVAAIVEMLTNKTGEYNPLAAFMKGFTEHAGGGFFGGLLEALLRPAFGDAGAYVILIIGGIICVVLITQRSIFKGMKKGGEKLVSQAKESTKAHMERYRERQKMRMDNKAAGVSLNTTLVPEPLSDEKEVEVGNAVSQFSGPDEFEELKDTTKETRVVHRETAKIRPGEEASLEERSDDLSELIIQNAFKEEESEEEPEPSFFPVPEPEPYAPENEGSFAFSEPEPVGSAIVAGAEALSAADAVSLSESEMELAPQERRETVKAEPVAEKPQAEEAPPKPVPNKPKKYVFPDPKKLLNASNGNQRGDDAEHLRETAKKLQVTLQSFGVKATVTNATCGPTVTRYELQPEIGVKVSKIVGLADDIKLNLAAADIRIEAPIPGKSVIGIEVPNQKTVPVLFREMMLSPAMSKEKTKSEIAFGTGKDIGGEVVVSDIAKMPHVLIAGATGSGKSVCINTIIMSILYRAHPDHVKLIMIDPKVVELSIYNGIPHLLKNVVTDPHEATMALNWAVAEMDRRYQLFAQINVRDLAGYNKRIDEVREKGTPEEEIPDKLPQIVVIVDELADLMMVASGDVEGAICRLAQLARACGIHLVIATQRPSVNVITGLIKANMPSRIAFAVTSGVDSRTILDMVGAEKLLGKGDMLYFPQGIPKPIRVQGAFVSDDEVRNTVEFIKEHNQGFTQDPSIEEEMRKAAPVRSGGQSSSTSSSSYGAAEAADDGRDAYFIEAAKLIIDKDKASIGMLQRAFKIGFNRAARIMDQLEDAGVVGPEAGTKPREILMSEEQLENYLEENG